MLKPKHLYVITKKMSNIDVSKKMSDVVCQVAPHNFR